MTTPEDQMPEETTPAPEEQGATTTTTEETIPDYSATFADPQPWSTGAEEPAPTESDDPAHLPSQVRRGGPVTKGTGGSSIGQETAPGSPDMSRAAGKNDAGPGPGPGETAHGSDAAVLRPGEQDSPPGPAATTDASTPRPTSPSKPAAGGSAPADRQTGPTTPQRETPRS